MIDLKRFRNAEKITQKELAEFLGCTQSFVSALEKGLRQIPNEMLLVLQSRYGDISQYTIEETTTDTPAKQPKNVSLTEQSLDFIAAGGEAFSTQLVRMMNEKQIAPYQWLEDRDKTIAELNREIGRLEARLEEAKKEVAPVAASVGCATAG